MRISLKPEHEAWLKQRFSVVDEASLEAAAQQMIDERIAEWEDDDLSWAKFLVDEGLAALARGESISLEEHKKRNAARIAALKR
jgi:antitoxin ParD1/3/4